MTRDLHETGKKGDETTSEKLFSPPSSLSLSLSLSLICLCMIAAPVHADSAELTYYFDGLDFETETVWSDPNLLWVLFGPEDDIAHLLKPSRAGLADFSAVPAVDFHFEYAPLTHTQITLLPEDVMQAAVIAAPPDALQFDDILALSFQEVPAGGQLAIDVGQILVFELAPETFGTIALSSLSALRLDVEMHTISRPVPEPTSSILLALGLLGLGIIVCRKAWNRKGNFNATVVLLCLAGLASTASGQEFTVKKSGTGAGTVLVGDKECGPGCVETTMPVSDDTALLLKASPAPGTRFIHWEDAQGRILTRMVHIQPEETAIAVFRYVMPSQGGTATQIGSQVFTTFPAGAIPKPALIAIETLDDQNAPLVTEGMWRMSPVYAFHAQYEAGQTLPSFDTPVDITLPYSPEAVSGVDESAIIMMRYDPASQQWLALPSVVDTAAQQVTAQTNRFGAVALCCPVQDIPLHEFDYPYWFEQFDLPKHDLAPLFVGQLFTRDVEITPFEQAAPLYGLALQADIQLYSEAALIRVVLLDTQGNEHLVYEAYPLITPEPLFSVAQASEETWCLDGVTPAALQIQAHDAAIHIRRLLLDRVPKALESPILSGPD